MNKYSISPPSTSIEETEKVIGAYLPDNRIVSPLPNATSPLASAEEASRKAYKIAYAVHEVLSLDNVSGESKVENNMRFIGLVSLVSLSGYYLRLPEHLVISKEQEKDTLVVELAYSFLPHAWGKKYATEAVCAVLQACKSDKNKAFWEPWASVWLRVIVNERNPPSLRVMQKCGMEEKGIFKWQGKKILIGGEWRTEDNLHIFGGYLRGRRDKEVE